MSLVTILATSNQVLIAVAKSALESAGIPFVVQGEGVQDLVGLGRFPGGLNLVTGPMQIQVTAENADEARGLLADLHD